MKAVHFLCCFILLSQTAVAQEPDTTPIIQPPLQKVASAPKKKKTILWYVNAPNLSYGNFYLMAGLGFTMMSKQHWGVALEIKSGTVNATNLPADFKPYGFIIFGDGIPDDKSKLVLLSALREFKIISPKIVATLQAGISYAEREYPDHFVFVPTPTSFGASWFNWGDTYDYEYVTSKTIGMYLKPGVKYLFSKNIAISVAPWTVLQQSKSYYGIELGLHFGKLR